MNRIDPLNNSPEEAHPLQSFSGKLVVSMDSGKKIGSVEDILIDPGSMRIESIVTSAGGFLRSNVRAIKAEDVAIWGEDVVLVQHSNVIREKGELTGLENCLSAYDDLPGRDVISMEGDRLGKVEDLRITVQGQLTGFAMNRGRSGLADLLMNDRKDHYLLPISALHSFGKDVLVIDTNRARDVLTFLDPEREEMVVPVENRDPSFIPATGRDQEDEHATHDLHTTDDVHITGDVHSTDDLHTQRGVQDPYRSPDDPNVRDEHDPRDPHR